MKVYVVGGAISYADFLSNVTLVDSVEKAEVVLFTGGEDVDPSIYKKTRHRTTHSNLARDKEEMAIFNKVKSNQLCVGICRGSQFLCAMNGGILVQNCNGHCLYGTHMITDGHTKYQITSTHHQMQYPFGINSSNYQILFWADCGYDFEGDGVDWQLMERQPEVVKYNVKGKPVCIAIQGHPEMMPESPVAKMLDKLIVKTLKSL